MSEGEAPSAQLQQFVKDQEATAQLSQITSHITEVCLLEVCCCLCRHACACAFTTRLSIHVAAAASSLSSSALQHASAGCRCAGISVWARPGALSPRGR